MSSALCASISIGDDADTATHTDTDADTATHTNTDADTATHTDTDDDTATHQYRCVCSHVSQSQTLKMYRTIANTAQYNTA